MDGARFSMLIAMRSCPAAAETREAAKKNEAARMEEDDIEAGGTDESLVCEMR